MFQKTTINIVLAMLCLNFSSIAQDNKAIDVTAKGIQIGQQVPDITITGLHNYKDKNGKIATTAKISDFKGKLLILDFWATWCSPCVAMIPKMDSLQRQFGDKVQFLSVTYQTEKEVLPFLEKFEKQQNNHYDLAVVTDQKELHKLFPHVYLPHYVWIDSNGIVCAITDHVSVTKQIIVKILADQPVTIREKQDIPVSYDISKLLLIKQSDIEPGFIMRSAMTAYMEGVGRGNYKDIYVQDSNTVKRITARNQTIPELFRLAYSKEVKETLLEVQDSSYLQTSIKSPQGYRDWLKDGHAYCYELVVNDRIKNKAFTIMQNQLQEIFPVYQAKMEKRQVKCLALVRTSNLDKIRTAGGSPDAHFDAFGSTLRSCYLWVFIQRMQFYLQAYPLPLINETNYTDMVDIQLNANMGNVEELNKALKKYDLQLIVKNAELEMLVIKDQKP